MFPVALSCSKGDTEPNSKCIWVFFGGGVVCLKILFKRESESERERAHMHKQRDREKQTPC